MVHHLEVPDPLTALGVEADYALAEEIVSGTLAAVVVVADAADGQIDIVQLLVGGH